MGEEKRELTEEEMDQVNGGMQIVVMKNNKVPNSILRIPFRILAKRCPYCSNSYGSQEDLNKHIQTDHPDK